jgi:hypothetical protein
VLRHGCFLNSSMLTTGSKTYLMAVCVCTAELSCRIHPKGFQGPPPRFGPSSLLALHDDDPALCDNKSPGDLLPCRSCGPDDTGDCLVLQEP